MGEKNLLLHSSKGSNSIPDVLFEIKIFLNGLKNSLKLCNILCPVNIFSNDLSIK